MKSEKNPFTKWKYNIEHQNTETCLKLRITEDFKLSTQSDVAYCLALKRYQHHWAIFNRVVPPLHRTWKTVLDAILSGATLTRSNQPPHYIVFLSATEIYMYQPTR